MNKKEKYKKIIGISVTILLILVIIVAMIINTTSKENDEVDTCYCECRAYAEYGGLCKHCVAVLLQYNDYEKAYMLMNSVFPDSKNFLQTVFFSDTASEYCIDPEIITIYLTCLKKLKSMSEQNIDKDNMSKTEEKVYKYCLYYSKVLKKMFTKKMGPVSIETIINKLYQTFNTEQELIEELTGQEVKSKIKR